MPSTQGSLPNGAAQRFVLWFAVLLLALNIIGFAPTYFLRGAFNSPELPLRTKLHGVLFTSWFVLLIVQSVLVQAGQRRFHRRLGGLGAVLAGLMVLSGLSILYRGVLEFRESGGSVERASQFLWGNLILVIAFASFVALGVWHRRNREAHMRLMMLASLAMMGQALARIGRSPSLQISPSPMLSEAAYGLGGLALLLGIVMFYDRWTLGRVHGVVRWGAPLLMIFILVAALVLPTIPLGQALVYLLYN